MFGRARICCVNDFLHARVQNCKYIVILNAAFARAEGGIDGVNQWDMLSKGAPSNRFEFVYNIDTIMNSTAIRCENVCCVVCLVLLSCVVLC